LQATSGEQHHEVALPETSSGYETVGSTHTFGQWLQIGLAFTLPLIIFGIVALVIFFWMTTPTGR
ncbi:MAG: hypothetical protein ACREF8_00840, partial [Chthoniobacterales bacterium]